MTNPSNTEGEKKTSRLPDSSNHTTPEREAEANIFAFELLMPEDDVRKQTSGIDILNPISVKKLAKRYNVESSIMTIRLAQLSLEHK